MIFTLTLPLPFRARSRKLAFHFSTGAPEVWKRKEYRNMSFFSNPLY
jgi:hypothetical protein